MVMTESELRELWRDGRQALPAFPPGTRFTPAALDFLRDHGLTARFAAAAVPGERVAAPAASAASSTPLPPAYLAARLDSLHALALLAAAEARHYHLSALAAELEPLAAEVQTLHVDLVAGRPSEAPPPEAPGAPAFPPASAADHPMSHWLNLLRATAREAEVLAAAPLAANAPLAEANAQLAEANVQLAEANVQLAEANVQLAAHLHRLGHRLAALAEGFRSGALAWQPG